MSKKHFIGLLLWGIFCSVIHAQVNCQDTYDRESIYLRTEFVRGLTYVKAGTPHSVGLFLNRMKPEFEKNHAALPLFKKSQRNKEISFAAGLLGIGGAVVGVIQANKQIDVNGNISNEARFQRNIRWMIISTMLSAAVTIPLNIQSRKHLDDAIWIRNRDVLR